MRPTFCFTKRQCKEILFYADIWIVRYLKMLFNLTGLIIRALCLPCLSWWINQTLILEVQRWISTFLHIRKKKKTPFSDGYQEVKGHHLFLAGPKDVKVGMKQYRSCNGRHCTQGLSIYNNTSTTRTDSRILVSLWRYSQQELSGHVGACTSFCCLQANRCSLAFTAAFILWRSFCTETLSLVWPVTCSKTMVQHRPSWEHL